MAPVSSSDIFTEKFASRAYRRSSGDVFPVARSIRTLAIVVFIVVYGLVCYQIGAEFRSIEQFVQIVDAPVPPCDHYNAGFAHVRKRELDESQMPYKCGVVFFYHVPSTGGSTINKWLLNFTPKNGGNVKYFTHWGGHHSIGDGERVQKAFVSEDDGGMNAFVKDLEPNEWRIAHCHHNSLHLNESEHLLDQWRFEVEAQGCAFVGNIMLRESLSHTLSLYKHLRRYNSTDDDWTMHLKSPSELGHWATELDFFLYNNLARNPHGVSKEEKVRRGLELLGKHFDIVTVGNHDKYKGTLLKMTGWKDREMPRHNTHNGELIFTKTQVEELQQLLTANGDIDFISEVKKMYDE